MNLAARITSLLVLAGSVSLACGKDALKPRLPLSPPLKGKIAYVSFREFYPQIYVMNADGSGQTRLTNRPIWNEIPTWSPDGRRVAWIHSRDDSSGLYVMNADGSSQRNLAPNMGAGMVSGRPENRLHLCRSNLRDEFRRIWLDEVHEVRCGGLRPEVVARWIKDRLREQPLYTQFT